MSSQSVASPGYVGQSRRKLPNRLRDLKNVKFGDRGADMDPELEFVVSAILDSGLSIEKISDECDKVGHRVSPGTLIGWIYGGTKKPQNFTMTIVMRALGYEKHWSLRNQ